MYHSLCPLHFHLQSEEVSGNDSRTKDAGDENAPYIRSLFTKTGSTNGALFFYSRKCSLTRSVSSKTDSTNGAFTSTARKVSIIGAFKVQTAPETANSWPPKRLFSISVSISTCFAPEMETRAPESAQTKRPGNRPGPYIVCLDHVLL